MKIIALTITCFFCTSMFAQNLQNANWCFGWYAGVNFNTSPPSPFTSQINYDGNTNPGASGFGASVSNSNGDLQFYTDGINVWNRYNQLMPNGNGLFGYGPSNSQKVVIVPKPNHPNIFYVFTMGLIYPYPTTPDFVGKGGIHYTIVNMNLNNGNGDVDVNFKNVIINSHNGLPIDYFFDVNNPTSNPMYISTGSRMTTTINATGDKIWLSMIPDFFHNQVHQRYFYNFLISENGINNLQDGISPQPLVVNLLNQNLYHPNCFVGNMKISPNGQSLCDGESVVNLYNYNNQTGIINNATTIFDSWQSNPGYHTTGFGVEFSPNSQLVYFTDNPYGIIQSGLNSNIIIPIGTKNFISVYQFNLITQGLQVVYNYYPIVSSKNEPIVTPLPVQYPFGLQLGLNNKIYVCAYGVVQQYISYLGVINNPNIIGVGCNLNPAGLLLAPNTFQNGCIPQWVHQAQANCTINLPRIQ